MSVVLHAGKNQEWARHGNHSPTMGQPGSKPKPSPPPKPTRSKSRQYESIEQYLVDKGTASTHGNKCLGASCSLKGGLAGGGAYLFLVALCSTLSNQLERDSKLVSHEFEVHTKNSYVFVNKPF